MIDKNEYVMTRLLVEKVVVMEISEVITKKHYNEHRLQPTDQIGSILIDRIFAFSSIVIQEGGYLPFGLAPLDYYAI